MAADTGKRRRTTEAGREEVRSEPRLALVSDVTPIRPADAAPLWLDRPERAPRSYPIRKSVDDLIECVSTGRIFEAIDEFYAPDVRLSQGAMAPMFCLDPRLGRGDVSRRDLVWERFSADGVGVNGDTSFTECELEFSSDSGQSFVSRYVAISQWRDGKIVRESLQFVG